MVWFSDFDDEEIVWRTKRQVFLAHSSNEAQYVAAPLTTKEGLWIKTIIEERDIIKLNEVCCP